MLEIQNVLRSARRSRYVAVPDGWYHYEVPHGLAVELPWVVTYLGTRLFSPTSGVWTVFYTEWCAQVAAALLWDTYDNCRIFWIPPAVRAGIRAVDLTEVLGSPDNYQDVLRFLTVIDQVNRCEVDPTNGTRPPRADLSPTLRDDAGGTFV